MLQRIVECGWMCYSNLHKPGYCDATEVVCVKFVVGQVEFVLAVSIFTALVLISIIVFCQWTGKYHF
jgi:hypothetical protein